jgi:hypothetical protein
MFAPDNALVKTNGVRLRGASAERPCGIPLRYPRIEGRVWHGFGAPLCGMMHGQNVLRLRIRVHLALILATFVWVASRTNSFP